MNYRYWDADCFLGWLNAEPEKVPFCGPVLQAARSGDVVIVTSAITIAEVLWLRGQPKLPPSRSREIEAFFRHRWIVLRELDRFVAEDARVLVWEKNVHPKDAMHLATALRQDVQLDQFDRALIKLSGKLGDPPLLIGNPNLPPKLPFEEDEDESDEG